MKMPFGGETFVKSVSAVINARLQSTRIPRKLVRPFAGRSLIEIALEKLDRMDFFEHRYLAAAEDELKALADRYENVEILERGADAVKKGVNPQQVTFAHYLRVPSDYIFMFNPCLPFVTVDTIREAHDVFQSTNYPSYTSVVPVRDWYFDEDSNPITNRDPSVVNNEDGETHYKCVHAFHIMDKAFFRDNGYLWTFAPHDPHCIPISMDVSIDIDHQTEFDFAEYLYLEKS